jgi:hypothetical protein
MTKKNIEAKSHWESRHPTLTFAACFPGQLDPTVASNITEDEVKADDNVKATTTTAPTVVKKKTADLSFLDAALDSKAYAGKKK